MHGQFLLVRLETEDEAVLGRITSLSSAGKLSSGSGEEFNIRAVQEGRSIPEDLREQYLKYRIDIRVLGVVRNNRNGRLSFIASHRRLPHVGSPVAFLSDDVLCELTGHNDKGADLGHFALGEFVYCQGSEQIQTEEWMQIKAPEVLLKFPIENLLSRRTFIFARAGFGKSNLNKLLFSKLYSKTPTVTKRGDKEVPVGTVLFDPEGEYFWPDDKGRPGFCDVPELEDKLVVFTNRRASSDFYQSFVAGGIRLDIRRLKPSDVISIALSSDRQDQQNVRKLRGLSQSRWEKLVNLIDTNRHQTPLEDMRTLLNLEDGQDAEALAARANMTTVVSMLHDKSSQLMDRLIGALSQGKLCVVDVSQMRGYQSLILSSLILRRIFDRNQQEFTEAEPKTIPTIAVVEEAQAVLDEKSTGSEPYIAWVKEGRKYDLGAVLVTQQPGSIPTEILSQGDNWFIFHLLSATDLGSLRKANAHFSEDILGALLNEPIPGQGIFWSSANMRPYPVALRALSFEKIYSMQDPEYNRSAAQTFARRLTEEFVESRGRESVIAADGSVVDPATGEVLDGEPIDSLELINELATSTIRDNQAVIARLNSEGVPWGELKHILKETLPTNIDDLDRVAFESVAVAMERIFGQQGTGWEAFKNESTRATWVRSK